MNSGKLIIICLLLVSACKKSPYMGSNYVPPKVDVKFSESKQPPAPDYSLNEHWCALPWLKDMADSVPNSKVRDAQKDARVDVFFVHPTLYLDEVEGRTFIWNADVNDSLMNARVDGSAILNQASVFNGSCRVFAPRYRQAHITSFFTSDKKSGQAALDLAYQDVKQAFNYYMANHNNGRPFILAGHSQGTLHVGTLLKEEIEGTVLQKQLVAAYIIGMPVPSDFFTELPICDSPNQTNCFITWATYEEGYFPPNYESYKGGVCVNPLSWTTDSSIVSRDKNLGGITWKFTKVEEKINGAQVKNGILWIDKPHVPGRMFIKMKNYHVADYNLFWFNIRENVRTRVDNYFLSSAKF